MKTEVASLNMMIFAFLCIVDPSLMSDMIRAMIDTLLLGIFLIEGIVVAAKPYLGLVGLWLALWYLSAKVYLRFFCKKAY